MNVLTTEPESNHAFNSNPSQGYFIAEVGLTEAGGVLQLLNVQGLVVYTQKLDNRPNQYVINTTSLPKGNYVVSLLLNGKLIQSIKLTVQ